MTLDLSALAAPPDDETRRFVENLRETLRDLPPQNEVSIEETRRARAEGRGLFPPGGPSDEASWLDVPTHLGRVRVSRPDGPSTGVYLHIHGGGWTFGAPEQYDLWNLALAKASGATVVSVPYRLGPEHPWPACIEDVEAAALWLLARGPEAVGAGPGRARWLIVGGESAGGHLAALLLQRLHARGHGNALAGGVLNYGCLDLRGTPSLRRWGTENLILSTPVVDWFVANLTAGRHDLADPALSPLLGDLGCLPPLLIQCGTLDPLLDDSIQMAVGVVAGGGEATLRLYPGGVHAFDRFHTTMADRANGAVATFIADKVRSPSP